MGHDIKLWETQWLCRAWLGLEKGLRGLKMNDKELLNMLLAMFSARVICTYTPKEYSEQVIIARNNRMRWGMGQW